MPVPNLFLGSFSKICKDGWSSLSQCSGVSILVARSRVSYKLGYQHT